MLHPMDFLLAYPQSWYIYSDSNLDWIQGFLSDLDPNYRNYGGFALIHSAVNIPFDNDRVVTAIIKAGADANSSTHLNLTPLHFAVFHRKQKVIEALIECGVSINAKDFIGRTCLHFAVSTYEFVSFWPHVQFHYIPDSKIIKTLLRHEELDRDAVDFNGETALMMAVKKQEVNAAILLLKNKANPNICNNTSETPLHVAFALPPTCTEIQLLLNGANIYSLDKNGDTPLDIFLKKGLSSRSYEWMFLLIKLIVFRYSITRELKQKFEINLKLSKFFNKCCDEVDLMRRDFVTSNITIHDFCWDCFDEMDFKFFLLQIHKPVVERLVKDVYPEYFLEIFDMLPEFSLFSILQMTACSRKRRKAGRKVKELADLFSIMDVIYMFSEYLSNVEIFCLIVAFSDVVIADSMQNIHEREPFYNLDLNWE